MQTLFTLKFQSSLQGCLLQLKKMTVLHKELREKSGRSFEVMQYWDWWKFPMTFTINLVLVIYELLSTFISKDFGVYTTKSDNQLFIKGCHFFFTTTTMHPFKQSIDLHVYFYFTFYNLTTILTAKSGVQTFDAIFQSRCFPCQHSRQFSNNIYLALNFKIS